MSNSTAVKKDLTQIQALSEAVEYFTAATEEFKQAYLVLQQQVARLNDEIQRKNQELRASLHETRELKNYLNSILSSINAGVICCDLKGHITVFNRAAEQLTGFQASEVLGKPYDSLFGTDLPSQYRPLEVLRRRKPVLHHEKQIVRKNGELLPVKFSLSILYSEENVPIGVVEVFEDLSEIRRWERELQHARTLMALGEMAGQVAHQIRNPLGAIAGFAALLDRDIAQDDPRKRLIRKIIEGVGNLDRIIGHLVFLARPVEPNFRKVNLKWLLNDVLEHIAFESRAEGKAIRFAKKFPRQKVEGYVDPQLFQQMMLHLFRNAVQAIEEEGEISLQLQKIQGGGFRVVLRDNGRGMPPGIQERLFHPFATTRQRGTGLGLPIARKIVELHRGKIEIKSREKRGTRVTLEFYGNMKIKK
jgi:PAS domain S-box-containing protein